ncbi:MAG: TonB-dependent receptor [Bacteroidota bacterium]
MIKKHLYILLFFSTLMAFATNVQAQTGSIKGFVYDEETGEACVFTNVYIENTNLGAATDANGFFNINKVPEGKHTLTITYMGYDTLRTEVKVTPGGINSGNYYLTPSSVVLDETVISAEQREKATHVRTSVTKVEPTEIKRLPTIGAEPDLAQYLQVVPGVIFTGDQGGQLYIRGGSPIQNLVLLDGMTIYNPFHSIGLFSVFDSDIIKNTDVYTGGFSAEYGGRISSVMDIRMRSGNKKHFAGKLSLSPFGAKVLAEGPFKKFEKGKSSATYIVSAKTSYLNETSKYLYTYINDSLPFSYTDIYGKVSYNSPQGSKLNVFGFNFTDQVNYGALSNLNWNSSGIGSNFVVVPPGSSVMIKANMSYSDYGIEITDANNVPRRSEISGFDGGLDFVYFFGKDEFIWGIETRGFTTDFQYQNSIDRMISQKENTTELATYANYKANLGALILNPSMRIHYYASLDDVSWEPRLGVKYNINERLRLKFAGGLYSQNFIAANSDRDVVNLFYGFLSGSDNIPDEFDGERVTHKLQKSQHAIFGVEYDFTRHFDVNLEGYFKNFSQLTNINRNKIYEDSPENEGISDFYKKDFIIEKGYAYGADIVFKYDYKRIYIWAVYGLGWVKRIAGDEKQILEVYAPHFDRRHNVNLLSTYQLGKDRSWEISARWNLGSGFPFTKTKGYYEQLPLYTGINADYWQMNGSVGIIYDEINQGRLPMYHRFDINIKKKFTFSERSELELSASVTNVYNRDNIFYFDRINNEQVNQLPIMPSFGLSLTF